MKPVSRDHRHRLLISGDELRELKRHTGAMAEAFGLDRKIENYKGSRPITPLPLGFGLPDGCDRPRPDLPPFYGPGAVRVGSTVTDGSSGRRSAAESARGAIAPNSAGVRYPNEL